MNYLNHYFVAFLAVFSISQNASALLSQPHSGFEEHVQSSFFLDGETCQLAIPIQCGDSRTGTTEGIVNDTETAGILQCVPGQGGQLWYVYNSEVSSPLTVSTCGQADFQMEIKVYSGECGTLSCIIGPGFCNGPGNELFFWAEANTNYFIRVGGVGDAVGNFTISATCAPIICLAGLPECVDVYSLAYYLTASQDHFCCSVVWDSICNDAYYFQGGPSVFCTDPLACNYSPGDCPVNSQICNYDCLGCTDPLADNYSPESSINDGSCSYQLSVCPMDLNNDGVVGYADVSAFFSTLGCIQKCNSDFNQDGIVNTSDFNLMLNFFGYFCY